MFSLERKLLLFYFIKFLVMKKSGHLIKALVGKLKQEKEKR